MFGRKKKEPMCITLSVTQRVVDGAPIIVELKRQLKALRTYKFNARSAARALQTAYLTCMRERDMYRARVKELEGGEFAKRQPYQIESRASEVYKLVHECACHIAEKENGEIVQSDFVMERLQKIEALCKMDVPIGQLSA